MDEAEQRRHIAALADPNAAVRTAAASALGESGAAWAARPLVEAWRAAAGADRLHVAGGLDTLCTTRLARGVPHATPEDFDLLLWLLMDPWGPTWRAMQAADAIERFARDAPFPDLRRALPHLDGPPYRAARRAVERATARWRDLPRPTDGPGFDPGDLPRPAAEDERDRP